MTVLSSDNVVIVRNGRGLRATMASLTALIRSEIPAPVVTAAWADITGKPSTFAPSAHDHGIADVTGLQGALDGKVDVGGGGSAPLALWDFWKDHWFGNNNAAASDHYAGAAISSGTANTAIPAASLQGFNRMGVFLRSSATANGGYRFQTSSTVADYFGVQSHKFRCAYKPLTAFAGRTLRIGYHDSVTSADAVDGAYFEIVDAVCSAKTASNSARTTNATTLTLQINVAYTFDIEVNAEGTSARFRVYAGTDPTPVLDVTNTANIPTTTARTFGSGIVATEASTTASDIGILYMLGEGTLAGFNRANG